MFIVWLLSQKFCWIFFEPLHHCRFHFLVTSIMFASRTHFHGTKELINIVSVMRKWKLPWWNCSKNSQQNFMRQGYMLSFEGGRFLLKEMMTMLRSRDVIHSGPASFWCMIHVPVLLIIPVQKKNTSLFDLPSFIYIYIYI